MTEYTELRPVKPSIVEQEDIEKRIKQALWYLVYQPLLAAFENTYSSRVFEDPKLAFNAAQNSRDSALTRALKTSRVTYVDGAFHGKFSAQTSKELKKLGAVWDRKSSSWVMPGDLLPASLHAVASASAARFAERLQAVDRVLEWLDPAEVAGRVKTEDLFDSSLLKIDRDLGKTLNKLSVLPELTEVQRKDIARNYAGNLDRSIKGLTTEQIAKLRGEIQAMVASGARYDTAVKAIQQSYSVSRNRARLIARQETNLLLSAFKQSRYLAAGVPEYKWKCVIGTAAHPVRPSHKKLDGTIQRWDSPPITTAPNQPQRRNHPSEDFNCRCTAIPLVRKRK